MFSFPGGDGATKPLLRDDLVSSRAQISVTWTAFSGVPGACPAIYTVAVVDVEGLVAASVAATQKVESRLVEST
jgi:hypothetical protein